MWPAALDKYVRYLEAVEIRESAPIEVKPLEWKRTGNLLQTATAHGLFYYVIEDFKIAGDKFTTIIACEVIYSGDDQREAESAAQDDLESRLGKRLVQGDASCK